MKKIEFRVINGKSFGRVTVAEIDGKQWISGIDAARATGHEWTDFAVNKYVKECDRKIADIPDTQVVVNISGLHSLAAGSRKPYAEKAEKAITEAISLQEELKTAKIRKEVTNMENQVTINGQELPVREYNGQRVVTFKDIDRVHGRPEGTARKRFNDNKKHFVEGVDYFTVIQPSEIRTLGVTRPQGGFPEKVMVMAESGYLMLAKSFTDDLAWDIQRELVNRYFVVEAIKTINNIPATDNRELDIKEQELKFKQAELLFRMTTTDTLSDNYKNALITRAVEMITGEPLFSADNTEEKSSTADMETSKESVNTTEHEDKEKLYSATEAGAMFGLTRQKLVRIAKLNNIHGNKEYGRFQMCYYKCKNKSETNFNNVFYYNEKAIIRFREILGGNQLTIDVVA